MKTMSGSEMSIQCITLKLLFPFKLPLSKCHILDPKFISLSHLLQFSFTKYLLPCELFLFIPKTILTPSYASYIIQ